MMIKSTLVQVMAWRHHADPHSEKCFHDVTSFYIIYSEPFRCWRGIHRSSGNSPHKGQWRAALLFSLTCAWINRGAGDLRPHRARYDVTVITDSRHKCRTHTFGFPLPQIWGNEYDIEFSNLLFIIIILKSVLDVYTAHFISIVYTMPSYLCFMFTIKSRNEILIWKLGASFYL